MRSRFPRWFQWAAPLLSGGGADTVPSAAQSSLSLDAYVIDVSAEDVVTPDPYVANAAGTALAGKAVTYALAACVVDGDESSVSVYPAEIADDGADTAVLTAYVYDAETGAPIPDILAASWSLTGTTNLTVTPIDSASSAAGRMRWSIVSSTAASYTIGGSVDGTSLTATVGLTVSGMPVADSFSNEPPGLSLLGFWNNEATASAEGWDIEGVTTYGSKTRVTTGPTGTPSIGGSASILTFLAGGTEGGHDPQRQVFDTDLSGLDELFFGALVQFKDDYPRSNNQGGGKEFIITFGGGGSGNRYFLNCDIGYGLGQWEVYQASTPLRDLPTVGSHPEYLTGVEWTPGYWQKFEWYFKRSTGAMKLWIDGSLVLDKTGLTFPGDGTFASIYDDGENNGNRIPPSVSPDLRYINNTVENVDAYRWTAALYLAGA